MVRDYDREMRLRIAHYLSRVDWLGMWGGIPGVDWTPEMRAQAYKEIGRALQKDPYCMAPLRLGGPL